MKFRWETKFKETEIGEIPKDWEVTNLGDDRFFKILPSGIKKFEGFKEYLSTSSVEGNEIVKIEEFITYNKRPLRANMQPVENSVWLARMINSPKFLKANKDLIENKILSTGFLGIQTKVKETCDYLFYYIQTKEFQEYKDAYVTGAVQESLTNENAKELLVILPPLPEQSRIATVLSYFDDLIEVKKRQNEILEKTAMAIFKSWFIDFEPFKDGEFVYNEELGKEIPKGWEVKKIGEVAEIIMGQSPPSKFYNEDGIGIPFIQGKGQLGKYTPQTTIFCSCDGKLARIYDILLTVRAPVGELNLADKEYIIGRGIASIRSNYWPFLFLYFNFNRELLKSLEKGTTYDAIVKEDIENFLAVIPPPHILQTFHSLVEPLFLKIILNQKQIMTLRKIRDTLLPLLVFGKLRIAEV